MTVRERAPGGQWRFIAAILALAGIWLIMLLCGRGPIDRAVYLAMYAGHRPVLLVVAHVLTALGDPTVLIGAGVVCAAWLWYAGHRHLPLVLIAIVAIGRGLSEFQKFEIARPRPDL